MSIDKAWDYSKPAESEERFRTMLAETSEDAQRAEIMTQLARSLGLQRKFDDAHEVLDDVEKMMQPEWQFVRLRFLLERGRTYNSSNAKDKARPLFLEAYELGKAIAEGNLMVDAAHMMGIVEQGAESLRWNEIAIADAEASENPRARNWLGALLNNTGWTYFDLGDFDAALRIFEKSLAWRQEMKHVKETLIAKWTIARTLRAMGKLTKALERQQMLLKEYQDANLPEPGYTSEEIGENLLALGRVEESKPHFAIAYDKLSQDEWLKSGEPERLERLKNLSV